MSELNVIVVVPLTIYGCFYADAKQGTSWFNDDEYRVTTYPIQTLTMLVPVSFFAADAIVMSMLFEAGKGRDIYIHHVVVGLGTLCSIYCGGLVFTLTLMNFLAEISTFTLNIRVLFQKFGLDSELPMLYTLIGLSFSIQFFWLRVAATWYIYGSKIFCWIPGFACYPFSAGIGRFEPIAEITIKICYTIYAFLQHYWFMLIVKGLLKVVGCLKKSKRVNAVN